MTNKGRVVERERLLRSEDRIPARVLVVDDEASMRELLSILLRREGFEVEVAGSGGEALALIERRAPELVIQDLSMPGMPGVELLEHVKKRWPQLPVIVITAFSTWDNAVEAMRLGAYDYIKKPFDTDAIRHVVQRAMAHVKTMRRGRSRHQHQPTLMNLVGNSPRIREAIEIVQRVAPTESTVLIQGESGTGKELVARMCHYYSSRAEAPFLSVNCGAFPESLLESELFGHVRGAFTGAVTDKKGLLAVADGGTFFLDEVGEMPLATQVKLLRVLEERQFYPVGSTQPVRVDVRFVCATNRDLHDEVRAGRFRGDLFYRLNVVPIVLPPLRERPEDIPVLAGYFVRKHAERVGREVRGIAPEVQKKLQDYPWPGNVRELENAIQRAIVLATGPLLEEVPLGHTPFVMRRRIKMLEGGARRAGVAPEALAAAQSGSRVEGRAPVGEQAGAAEANLPSPLEAPIRIPDKGFCLDEALTEIERRYLQEALRRTGGNLTRAAELLGITFRSIRYKVKKLGLRT